MAGRRQSTAAQKLAAGNPGHREIKPDADFSSAGSIGDPPEWLDAGAKTEFKRIVASLQDLDLLHSTDVSVLASYAVAYSRWVAAEQQVAVEGTVIKVDGSQGQSKLVKHPALTVSAESQKQMLRAGSLLGLNPADRYKLAAPAKQAANPFAALLNNEDDDD
jgi:P27 family predicted phage terminase small subunit